MRFLALVFIIMGFASCQEMHQKMYDAFHGKKKTVVKDSIAKIDSVAVQGKASKK